MIKIDGETLSIEQCVQVARFSEQVGLSKSAEEKLFDSRNNLELLLKNDKPIYGINTGYGIFADRKISINDTEKLNRNLILSHSVGTGDSLDQEVVKTAMLIRVNTLSKGFSGIRIEFIRNILKMINAGVVPVIPSQGSLGSSGDLCQLSHLALVLSKDKTDEDSESGKAFITGKCLSGKEAMKNAGIDRLILGSKEGLALINGATFSAAIAVLSVWDAQRMVDIANVALSLSLEALQGCSAAFDPRIQDARNSIGQKIIAGVIRKLLKGSTFIDSTNKVQDAYSLRCAPQVHGAVYDTLQFVKSIVTGEINAATDNPLIFDDVSVLSGGNFHGESLAMVMDFLAIALVELGAISERRIFRLTDNNLNNGLPAMLVDNAKDAGVNSGLMMPQYTAASLVLENQTLASPDSIHSLPTSANQEDHNANSMTASRHTRMIIQNLLHILATEIYISIRAIDLRKRNHPNAKLGNGTQKVYDIVREEIPYKPGDMLWIHEIDAVKEMIQKNIIPVIGC